MGILRWNGFCFGGVGDIRNLGAVGKVGKTDFGLGISEFGKDMVSCGNQSYVVGFADGRWLSIFDL